jgi:hypothetical protein
LRPALLLEPAVVVGGHARQRGDFLTAQAARAPARPGHEPDVLGLQRFAPSTQEIGELDPVLS